MPTTYAGVTSTSVSGFVQTAYDKLFEFGLRATPLFRSIADKRPANVTNPGESVIFSLYADLAAVTSALTENQDPDATALGSPTTVTVNLYEYGIATLLTKRLSLDALTMVDQGIANIVAFNAADSIDGLVQTVLLGTGPQGATAGVTQSLARAAGATTYTASGGSLPTLTGTLGTDTIKAADVRTIVARLRTNKVVPRKGNLFWAGIHPMVSADLRSETTNAPWRDPHIYNAPGQIWAGEIGEFEGVYFVENPRCFNSQAGSGTGGSQIRVFSTWFAGQQALAEAVNEEPHIVVGEVVDKLRRFFPLGWYGFLGWSTYRGAAILRYTSSASGMTT